MVENTRDDDGIGASHVVGGAATGLAAAYGLNRYTANKGIKQVLTADNEATEPFKKIVEEALTKDKELKPLKATFDKLHPQSQNVGLEIGNKVGNTVSNKVTGVKFTVGEDKKVAMEVFGRSKNGKVVKDVLHDIGKLPEGVEAGKLVKDQATLDKIFAGEKSFAREAMQKAAKSAEKQIVGGIRKASGFATGLRNISTGGKFLAGAGVIAAAAAGAKVAHAIFGGPNSNRVEAERNAPAQEQPVRG